MTGKHIRRKQMQVSLVGIGMGNTKLIAGSGGAYKRRRSVIRGKKVLLDAVPAQWNVSCGTTAVLSGKRHSSMP